MKSLVLLLLISWLPGLALGGVYQWTDEHGHVYFGNIPPLPQDEYFLGDEIKPAQKKAVQAEEKEMQVGKSVAPAEKEMRIKPPLEIRKAKQKEPEALTRKLHQGAGEVTPPLNNQKTGEQKERATPTLAKRVEKQAEKQAEIPAPTPSSTSVSAVAASLVTNQKMEVHVEETPIIEAVPLASKKDADKCGFFGAYVEQYKIKKSEGCPGPHCDVYKRQLKKFSIKQKRYC